MKYRKIPEIVEAYQWAGHDRSKPEGLIIHYYRKLGVRGTKQCVLCGMPYHNHGLINTVNGEQTVCIMDWVILNSKGEHSVCKPDVFMNTYEPCWMTAALRKVDHTVD